ncbi:MAG: hypothetical protein IPL74_15870 [Bacteroidetes bacterium]|nr:hypothetical protein [Bacteroidota bacterium]
MNFFLYSKGYYLEMDGEHWLKDKDLLKLKQMVDNPEFFGKKQILQKVPESTKWKKNFGIQKVDTKAFSYYEK